MLVDRIRLDSKVVLVIGAGGLGLGTRSALALVEAGAHVVAVDRDRGRLADVAAVLSEASGTSEHLRADATDERSISGLVAHVCHRHGRIDSLVHVVGGAPDCAWSRCEEYPDGAFEQVLELNLLSLARTSRPVIRAMTEAGNPGSIVTFATGSAVTSAPYHSAYGAAKAAVISFTKSMAVELGPRGIRVNAVAPGSVATPAVSDAAGFDFDYSEIAPLGRRCDPDEIAAAVLFLVSELSAGITGHVLHVDAGITARSPFGNARGFLSRLQRGSGHQNR